MSSNSELTVSIEPHLRETLTPILNLLPTELSNKLIIDLSSSELHYDVLFDVSKWSRSHSGKTTLQAQAIDPNAYNMISLLAGSKTSPSSKLPTYVSPESSKQAAARHLGDKKAITAIINALLSIGCSGVAAWWAADKGGWHNEWKVLLSFLAATAVAISEATLYIIWESRYSSEVKRRTPKLSKRRKKQDDKYDENTKKGDAQDGSENIDLGTSSSIIRRRTGITAKHLE